MPRNTFFHFIGTCIFTLLWVVQAQATVAVDMDIDALSTQATHIVHGKIKSIESRDHSGRINTVVTLEVERWAKHPNPSIADPNFVFELPGGTLGDLRQVVAGTPQYQIGQEVVLFLWQSSPSRTPRLMGLSQGSYHIQDGPQGKRASRDRKALGLVRKDAKGRFVPSIPSSKEDHLTLPGLFERIERAMSRPLKEKVLR